jgi:FKBP-type peptidyl-prolyl cis-trans isomerase SlyD
MKIAADTVVRLEYEARLGEERIEGTQKPKLILVGRERNLPPGLEAAIIGREAGERFIVSIPDAFGGRDEAKVVIVPKADLPVANLEIGSRFTAQDADGTALEARVVALDGDTATVDLNHPRAGKSLELHISILEVRAADAHELEHGHAHGDGGVRHQAGDAER